MVRFPISPVSIFEISPLVQTSFGLRFTLSEAKNRTEPDLKTLSTAWQAILMLCVLKKSRKLRTVFDYQLQNENMVKDVSPFLDQDAI